MSGWSRLFAPSASFSWVAMLVQALAWPAAAVAIAAILRSEIRLAVERLARLRYRSFEAQFRDELDRVAGLDDPAAAASPAATRLLDLPSESRRVFHELDSPTAAIGPKSRPAGPRSVIESAWAELEASADRAAGVAGHDPAPALASRGILQGTGLLAFERLRRLHRAFRVAAGWEPSGEVAEQFAGAARKVAARIRAGTEPGAPRVRAR